MPHHWIEFKRSGWRGHCHLTVRGERHPRWASLKGVRQLLGVSRRRRWEPLPEELRGRVFTRPDQEREATGKTSHSGTCHGDGRITNFTFGCWWIFFSSTVHTLKSNVPETGLTDNKTCGLEGGDVSNCHLQQAQSQRCRVVSRKTRNHLFNITQWSPDELCVYLWWSKL